MAVPANKRKVLRESVSRLLELGISDREILDNLKSVGVDEQLGREIIAETKSGKNSEPAQKAEPAQKQEEKATPAAKQNSAKAAKKSQKDEQEDSDVEDNIFDSVYEDDSASGQKQQTSHPSQAIEVSDGSESSFEQSPSIESVAAQVKSYPSPPAAEAQETEISALWEKGIAAAVDARLEEMKRIRDGLDEIIDQKIADKVKLESKKYESALASQREVFNGKIDLYLASHADELKSVLEARAKQLEDANAKVHDQLLKAQSEKKLTAEFLTTINDKLSGLETLRSQLISEVNKSLITHESKFADLIEQSTKKRDELEARITRSLQLESKIAEGLVEDAKNRIESMRLEKEKELENQIEQKISELDKLTEKIDPKGIVDSAEKMLKLQGEVSERIKEIGPELEKRSAEQKQGAEERMALFRREFDDYKDSVSKAQDTRFEELRSEYAGSLDELFSQQLLAWDSRMKAKEKQVDDLRSKIDVDKVTATIDSFDAFKAQFVATITNSIEDYNKTKRELAQSIMARDKSINEYLERIDAKMKELSDFQREFSAQMSGMIDSPADAKAKNKKQGKE